MGLDMGCEGGDGAVRVVVAGASGYIGTAVQVALMAAGHDVVAVSRRGAAIAGAVGVARDLGADAVTSLMEGSDAVINLVGIIRELPQRQVTFHRVHVELTRNVLRAAEQAGVPRYVQMSALGVGPRAQSRYFQSKWEAEQWVRDHAPDATVVRPSLVFGGGADFFATLKQLAVNPIVPVPGRGTALFDPVFRGDLAQAIVGMIEDEASKRQIYEIGGPKRFSLDALVDLAAQSAGRRTPVPKMHLSVNLLRPLVGVGERWQRFPLTLDQLAMLNQPNITDDHRWRRWVPNPKAPEQDL